jgi:large subunit ribosomal protein L1
MARLTKNYKQASEQIEDRLYAVEEALDMLKKIRFAKFDETVELHMRLGVDPKHADQMVRGTVVLPNGLGKSKTVCVIASGEKVREAEEAGAEFVGGEDLVTRIKGGWLDFEACIATPDMMKSVGKLGRVLGPRGLMPNPKIGTVTFDVAKAVEEIKAGKVEFRVDKTGVIHVPFGKVSFDHEKLVENVRTLTEMIIKARPAAVKGKYLRSITLATTMSPGIDIDPVSVDSKK